MRDRAELPGDPDPAEQRLLSEAWGAITGGAAPPRIEVRGPAGLLPSPLPVAPAAVAAIGAALLASGRGPVSLDRSLAAAAVCSERSFRLRGGAASAGFAPLSRFWATADGWIRTHANYPWHRSALLRTLEVAPDAGDEHISGSVAAVLAERDAEDVEEAVFDAGGIAAAVRTLDTWRLHPQGLAVAGEPLVALEVISGASPGVPTECPRVVDLTRVIAGPVCTRFLGAMGADVLRLDPRHHLDLVPGEPADTLLGKRSAFLDLRTGACAETLHRLLDEADALVMGYRPGALDRFGLRPDALADRHPGLVVAVIDAWGHTGPWADRRGFDSVVQAPTGIAAVSGDGAGGAPGALPCQLLDHATGYLAAAAVLDGITRQRATGGTVVRRLSLARTAAWLTAADTRAPVNAAPPAARANDAAFVVDVGDGVEAVAPPGAMAGVPLRWPAPPARFGASRPAWN